MYGTLVFVKLLRFPAKRQSVLQKVFICIKYYPIRKKYYMIRRPKSEMRGIKLLHNNIQVRTVKYTYQYVLENGTQQLNYLSYSSEKS